jgi:hypothetical protein
VSTLQAVRPHAAPLGEAPVTVARQLADAPVPQVPAGSPTDELAAALAVSDPQLLSGIPWEEIAIALAASDMPAVAYYRGPAPDHERIAVWAWQGIARLGPSALGHLAARDRSLAARDRAGTLTPGERAEYRGLWGGQRRMTAALANARWLADVLAALAGGPACPGIAAYLKAREISAPAGDTWSATQ